MTHRTTPRQGGDRVSPSQTSSLPQLAIELQGVASADGMPVVLSHALGLDMHMWDALAVTLADAGIPVLRYDHRGHGLSATPRGPYSMDDLVDDAARAVREWGHGPVVWVGISMGGMVGQGLAILHPDLVRGLVIANSTSRYPEAAKAMWESRIATVEAQGLVAIVDSVIERYFSPGFRAARPEVTAVFRRCVLETDPIGYVACCHAVAGVDWVERLNEIRCPTLVIAGRNDIGAPLAMSEAIVERISGAELVVFDDAAHLSVVEQPILFAETLNRFVRVL